MNIPLLLMTYSQEAKYNAEIITSILNQIIFDGTDYAKEKQNLIDFTAKLAEYTNHEQIKEEFQELIIDLDRQINPYKPRIAKIVTPSKGIRNIVENNNKKKNNTNYYTEISH